MTPVVDVGDFPPMLPTQVTWAFAPTWLTPGEAAGLLGPAYDEAAIVALAEMGAVEAEEIDGALVIDKQSLQDYQVAVWEVAGNGQEW